MVSARPFDGILAHMTRVLAGFDEQRPGGRRMLITRPFDLEEGDWSDHFDSSIVELTLDGSESVDIVFLDGQTTTMHAGDEFVIFRTGR